MFKNTKIIASTLLLFWLFNNAIAQATYIKSSNTDEFDFFGWSIAISDNTMVVGARGEDSNGEQDDNTVGDAGAAYVFTKIEGAWVQQDYLKASNPGDFDEFGTSIALSGDTIVVGAPNESSADGQEENNSATKAGAVYVFTYNGESWGQQAYIKAPTISAFNNFGNSVAISGDTIIVGEPREDNDTGAAHVYTRSNGIWSFQTTLKASNAETDDYFGWDVAIENDTSVVSAFREDSDGLDENENNINDSGAVYVFNRTANTWSQQTILKASNPGVTDTFGISVAISGNRVLVGASGEKSDANGVDGNQSNDNSLFAGAAYLFSQCNNTWTQKAYIKASNTNDNDRFGDSVAINGNQLVIGALNEGSNATGIDGDQTDNSLSSAGAAYGFTCYASGCTQNAYIKASNSGGGDFFAKSVAISNTNIAFGASSESSNAIGIDGIDNNDADGSGAVYTYQTSVVTTSPALDTVFENGFECF